MRSWAFLLLLLPGAAAAQAAPTLLDGYARVTTLLNYMTTYVGETLIACAEKNAMTEEQAEARFDAYRKRNAALLERAEAWSEDAEKQLRAQGMEDAARRQAERSGLSAIGEASTRAQGEVGRPGDVRARCAALAAAIESGQYDLSVNAEFLNLLKAKP